MTTLKIDDLVFPVIDPGSYTQTYSDEGARDFDRVADGSGVLRVAWSGKLKTTISARGWAPSTLEQVDLSIAHDIACATPRTRCSASTNVTLPATRRSDTDHEPLAYAVVGEMLVATSIINLAAINAGSTDVAALTAVADAIGYRVHYWPFFNGVITSANHSVSSQGDFSWQLEAAEL